MQRRLEGADEENARFYHLQVLRADRDAAEAAAAAASGGRRKGKPSAFAAVFFMSWGRVSSFNPGKAEYPFASIEDGESG